QEPSRVLSFQELEQSLNTHCKNNPLISELSPLTPTIEDTTNNTTTTTTDMDIDNSTLSDINQQHQQQHQQQQAQQQQQQQQQPQEQPQQSYSQVARSKLNPSFDWLANFSVTDEMKDKTKLQTEIS